MRYINVRMVSADKLPDGQMLVKKNDGREKVVARDIWERYHLPVNGDGTKVTQEMVDGYIKEVEAHKVGEKTTLVMVTLRNGFVLTETSACVSPENFDMEIGKEICMEKIKDKVWFLLGFLLQCARNGV